MLVLITLFYVIPFLIRWNVIRWTMWMNFTIAQTFAYFSQNSLAMPTQFSFIHSFVHSFTLSRSLSLRLSATSISIRHIINKNDNNLYRAVAFQLKFNYHTQYSRYFKPLYWLLNKLYSLTKKQYNNDDKMKKSRIADMQNDSDSFPIDDFVGSAITADKLNEKCESIGWQTIYIRIRVYYYYQTFTFPVNCMIKITEAQLLLYFFPFPCTKFIVNIIKIFFFSQLRLVSCPVNLIYTRHSLGLAICIIQ